MPRHLIPRPQSALYLPGPNSEGIEAGQTVPSEDLRHKRRSSEVCLFLSFKVVANHSHGPGGEVRVAVVDKATAATQEQRSGVHTFQKFHVNGMS